MPSAQRLQIGRQTVDVSNLDKVLYPAAGFTKGQVIDFYVRIAPVLLPHLKNRPLTLKRYPNGVDAPSFYEKRCPSHRPAFVKTAPVWSGSREGQIDFCLANDLPTLVWVANLASLELHTSLARARDVARPTAMVFDLDPGAPAALLDCCKVALVLKDLLARLKLEAVVKTSGAKGMQVYVPLNTPVGYAQTKGFSRTIAGLLAQAMPNEVVSNMRKSLRPGKVLVDWSQNDKRKTTVNVYSLRALERPTVSTPLAWREVEQAVKRGDAGGLVFEAGQVLERVETLGDLFAPVLELKQRLPKG